MGKEERLRLASGRQSLRQPYIFYGVSNACAGFTVRTKIANANACARR